MCTTLSAFLFSLAAVFVKLIGPRIPVFEIVFLRSGSCILISAASARAQGIPLFGRRENMALLAARGLVGCSAMGAFYMSISMLPLSDAVAIFFLNPSCTAALAWLVLGEAFGLLTGAGCAASLAGVALIVRPPLLFGAAGAAAGWSHERAAGTIFGLISAVLAAGAYCCVRYIGG